MNLCDRDILDRIDTPPLWFDESAVPRFALFTPQQTANIYADEVALVRIECQGCGHPFDVAFTSPAASKPLPEDDSKHRRYPLLRDYIRAGELRYGDPPNIRCCAAGPTMSSVPRDVIEYWVKPYILGEGCGSVWPRRNDASNPEGRAKPMPIILDLATLKFRRERDLEGVDLTPEWAR